MGSYGELVSSNKFARPSKTMLIDCMEKIRISLLECKKESQKDYRQLAPRTNEKSI